MRLDADRPVQLAGLTGAEQAQGLYLACRQLRADWPSRWPGLPHILARCLQALALDVRTDETLCALNRFALAVARDSELQVTHRLPEPAYHNRLHTADVLLVLTAMLHLLGTPQAGAADKAWASALLAAAVSHDYQHPGGVNQSALEIERASWQGVMPLALSLPWVWRERVKTWILGTDPLCVPDNHARVAGQTFAWTAAWLQVLLNEADIFISATAEFGAGMGAALSREWQLAAMPGYAHVATPAGRMQFLRSVRFSSPAAHALGIAAQVQAQLST